MIHLELRPEIEAQLAAEAQARGLALDRYIALIVESRAAEASSATSPSSWKLFASVITP